jgi:hypothetical protein
MKILTLYIHEVMKAETMKYIRQYTYKNIGTKTVYVYQIPVKKNTC